VWARGEGADREDEGGWLKLLLYTLAAAVLAIMHLSLSFSSLIARVQSPGAVGGSSPQRGPWQVALRWATEKVLWLPCGSGSLLAVICDAVLWGAALAVLAALLRARSWAKGDLRRNGEAANAEVVEHGRA
jgi:hypothetical protein